MDASGPLSTNATYTKIRQNPSNLTRLKVQSYRINEIWSIDSADMQQLSNKNKGVRYRLVAVNTLNCFVRVQYAQTSIETEAAFSKNLAGKLQPEMVWSDISSFKRNFAQEIFTCIVHLEKPKGICGVEYHISQRIDIPVPPCKPYVTTQ